MEPTKTVDAMTYTTPDRAEVERLAALMERVAWSDEAHSHFRYEQTAAALRALQATVDDERARCATLQDMLRTVGRWEHHGRSVAETYDMEHGAGSWRRALRA